MTKTMRDQLRADGELALAGLVHPEIIRGDPASCTAEFSKLIVNLCLRVEDDDYVRRITEDDVDRVMLHADSQIGRPEAHRSHIITTGYLFQSLTAALLDTHPDLDLPHPDIARAMGWLHDLNMMFSSYQRGGQLSKELDLFFLGAMNGWTRIADHMAMHSAYFEIGQLLTGEYQFPEKNEAYEGMREVLRGGGPLSLTAITERFRGYHRGTDNMPLLALTVVDYMERGLRTFDPTKIEADFAARSEDVLWRYHGKHVEAEMAPPPLGVALMSGGLTRIKGYKDIVRKLLSDDIEAIDRLRETTHLFKK